MAVKHIYLLLAIFEDSLLLFANPFRVLELQGSLHRTLNSRIVAFLAQVLWLKPCSSSSLENSLHRLASPPPLDLCDMSSRAPALGPQSVEIPESDEEAAGRRASPKVARVSAGPGPVGGDQAVTLADLQRLLEMQSAKLAKTQEAEIRGAMQELKQATTAELRGIKEEVTRHSDYITQLRDQGRSWKPGCWPWRLREERASR